MRMNLKRDLHAVVHEFDGQRSERFRKLHDVRDIPRRVVVDEHLLCGTGGQNGRVIGRREVIFGKSTLGCFKSPVNSTALPSASTKKAWESGQCCVGMAVTFKYPSSKIVPSVTFLKRRSRISQ